ncbi:MAG: C4-type zinc ribbon domain-containing protein [bacterium]
MVTADPAVQARLLDVQALDTLLAQLAHRRRNLPELATISSAEADADRLRQQRVGIETRLSDIAREQRRLEDEIDVVRSREDRDQARLTSGGIPAKELERLQHELQSLSRRQSTLEDDALTVMESREELETQLTEVSAQQNEIDATRTQAVVVRDAAWAEIDADIARHSKRRAQLAGTMPSDLMTLYDTVRRAQGGVGAALLRQRRCEGCRLELAGSELSGVRQAAPEDVVRCENCRRILVRTAESGL